MQKFRHCTLVTRTNRPDSAYCAATFVERRSASAGEATLAARYSADPGTRFPATEDSQLAGSTVTILSRTESNEAASIGSAASPTAASLPAAVTSANGLLPTAAVSESESARSSAIPRAVLDHSPAHSLPQPHIAPQGSSTAVAPAPAIRRPGYFATRSELGISSDLGIISESGPNGYSTLSEVGPGGPNSTTSTQAAANGKQNPFGTVTSAGAAAAVAALQARKHWVSRLQEGLPQAAVVVLRVLVVVAAAWSACAVMFFSLVIMPWVMLHLSTSSHPHFRALRFNHTSVEALPAAGGEKGQGSGGGGKVGGIVGGNGWGVRKGEVWRPRRGEGVCELGRGDWQVEREGYPLYAAEDCPFISGTFNCLVRREATTPSHPIILLALLLTLVQTLTLPPISIFQENGRTDFDYLHFAWRESDCVHSFTRFRADRFFEAFQNRRIVFVGDSTLLSMFQSLLCLLSVGPSLPPNHSLPTERLNRTFPSLLHPSSSSPSLLSSSPSSSSSSLSSPAGSKAPSPDPLIF
ncbi:unnamed protein product, partial [Closterium sp. NIES-53]